MDRHELRHLLVNSKLRHLAGPVFNIAVSTELKLIDLMVNSKPHPAKDVDLDVTAIIKTFERPKLLIRLVNSLKKHYPNIPIIIADDSRTPTEIEGTRLVRLPFDSGVSAGRAAALELVRTKYTWNFDDDLIVTSGTNAEMAIAGLNRNQQLDLIGGEWLNLPMLTWCKVNENDTFDTEDSQLIPSGSIIDEHFEVRDKVSSFFIARTDKLREVGYKSELKRLDHADFFTRARGKIVSAHCKKMYALHAQAPFDRNYHSFRDNYQADLQVLENTYSPLIKQSDSKKNSY
jgi:glycosyltransferase involved in cell wall biosynthesis